jgi:hypothetical protein
MQNRGAEAIENTFGEEVINQSKTIFVFKNANFNYFESNYQPFDERIDGDYLESCKNVNEIVFDTFKTQMPNAKIDSLSTIEKISGMDFHTFKVDITYPNGMTLKSLAYSRLFGLKEFSVNIMYVDDKQGKKMISSWMNSKFE